MSRHLSAFIKTVLFALLAAGAAGAQRGAQATKLGAISGRLLTREGKPAIGVRVSAIESRNTNPSPVSGADVSITSAAETDGEGRFRLEDVPAGSYVISAGLLDEPTFFPGVVSEKAARLVTVTPGSNVGGIDFRLVTVRFSGRVVRVDRSVPGSPPVKGKESPGSELPPYFVLERGEHEYAAEISNDGEFSFPALAPGEYRLPLGPGPGNTLTLGEGDVTGFQLSVPWNVALTGSAVIEGNAPLPEFGVRLRIADPASPAVTVTKPAVLDPTFSIDSFRFRGGTKMFDTVSTGVYTVTVEGVEAPFFVKSVTSGGLDLLSNPLRVSATGTTPIQIVLGLSETHPWPRVSGRFIGRGLWLDAKTQSAQTYQGTSLDLLSYLDGSFEIPRLLPGPLWYPGITSPGAGLTSGGYLTIGSEGVENALINTSGYSANHVTSSNAPVPGYGPRVRGQIVGRARAVPGVRYEVRVQNAAGDWWAAPISMDGTFEFAHLAPGIYSAEVSPAIPGAVPASIEVRAVDLDDVRITVPETRRVTGRVVLDSGVPMPHTLTLLVAFQPVRLDLRPDGSFNTILPLAQPVAIATNLLPPGFSAEPVAPIGEAAELRVVLRTPTASPVRGRVLADAATLAGGRVWLSDAGGLLRTIEVAVRGDGTFEVPQIPQGPYTVRFAGPGVSVGPEVQILVTSAGVEGLELLPK